MIIIPSIDILGGQCVRLYQGNYAKSTVYDYDPCDAARDFEAAGAKRIHLVDLDAARGGGNNRATIRRVRDSVRCLLEVGGGVRSEGDVEELLDAGVDRVIVGTMMIRDPKAVAAWAARHPTLIAGIDARDGKVRVSGWEDDTAIDELDAARWAGSHGMRAIVYTDISRDGTMSGPSFERTAAVATASGLPVILSGGVRGPEDVAAAAATPGIVGVITGRALYEGSIDLHAVMERYQGESAAEGW